MTSYRKNKNKIFKNIILLALSFIFIFSCGFFINTKSEKKQQEALAATRIQMAIAAANYLADFTWTCKTTFTGWSGNYKFYAGSTYHGVPYQQMGSYLGWNTSLSTMQGLMNTAGSAFYTSRVYPYGGSGCPKYGTDCSGFATWVIGHSSRQTTSSIGSLASSGSSGFAYGSKSTIKAGDLLNDAGSHVIFVTGVSGTSITTVESTPNGGNDIVRRVRDISKFSSYSVVTYSYSYNDPPVYASIAPTYSSNAVTISAGSVYATSAISTSQHPSVKINGLGLSNDTMKSYWGLENIDSNRDLVRINGKTMREWQDKNANSIKRIAVYGNGSSSCYIGLYLDDPNTLRLPNQSGNGEVVKTISFLKGFTIVQSGSDHWGD